MITREQLAKYLAECDWMSDAPACTHRDVGAVVVKSGDIVAKGRNTMPSMPFCVSGGCPRGRLPKGQGLADYSDCVAVHAEMNAIIRAGLVQCTGAILVVNSVPCYLCTRLARGAGIIAVYYRDAKPDRNDIVEMKLK